MYIYAITARYDATYKLLVYNMYINKSVYPYVFNPDQYLIATLYMDLSKRMTPVGSYTVRRKFTGGVWVDVTSPAFPLYITASV